jgi:prepilin-type N-terminal cleavage/methylation domain-containing protein
MHTLPLRKNRAFSLIELLVVVAVIGIIAAMAINSLNVLERGRESKNRRNAQSLVSVYNSAVSSGAVPVSLNLSSATDLASTQENARKIAAHFSTPRRGAGVNKDAWFSVAMSANEATACGNFLSYHGASNLASYLAGGDGVTTTATN